MKCRYRFPVTSRLRPSELHPIPIEDRIYEFNLDGEVIGAVQVTVPLEDDTSSWPRFEASSSPTEPPSIIIPPTGHLQKIRRELQVIEGLLSFYGLRSINLDSPTLEWIPENDAEREKLKVFSFGVKDGDRPRPAPLPFDLIARSVLAAPQAASFETALNFLRKGQIHVSTGDYIDAIYDFYFVLETLFGEGKWRSREVKARFLRSPFLIESVRETVADLEARFPGDHGGREVFRAKYAGRTPEVVIGNFVKLRGLLHHHNPESGHPWHPNDSKRFKTDGFVLNRIAYLVCFKLSAKLVFGDDVLQKYKSLFLSRLSRPGTGPSQ